MTPGPVDIYVAGFSGEVRTALEQLRDLLRERVGNALPGATETLAGGVPSLELDGEPVVHFAGFDDRVGLYLTPSVAAAFDAELVRFLRSRGSVWFAASEPLPVDLIARMVAFRLEEVTAAAAAADGS